MWPFRQRETPPDASARHSTTLDLIEQVATLRGQLRAVETEWDDVRAQIKKGFGRMERANQRAAERSELGDEEELEQLTEEIAHDLPLAGFAKKLAQRRGG